MIDNRKTIGTAIGLVVFTILVIFFSVSDSSTYFVNNACKTMTKRIKEKEISGIIIEKYLDKKSHMHETLQIDNNGRVEMLIIPNDMSGLYEFVFIGDSILKPRNGLDVEIINNSKSVFFALDFGCNESFE